MSATDVREIQGKERAMVKAAKYLGTLHPIERLQK